ncbi:MAG: hypothetical protein COT71_02170 [Candidatus Andersenbacteria bacterium CG10_big_fil_rev_8_21_14_0_10_54_11]|uniref:PDZ domain-containing protein n=1 Tax=Candidatus Andersenbacteria bacterium CG10_big_fil_rev_8_21_14_0_10_54_11 TaxID=1974485 RepID=A0A2M6WZG2_9BACT|nr:MAG: hypothetical protein COT71_02170 [Candidatus Andersenbacteria bacterium CG10_big_fil_rev_8_21_14_0_10_54_11]
MKSGTNVLVSAIAGAVGGALIILVFLSSPRTARLLEQNQRSEVPWVQNQEEPETKRTSYEQSVISAVQRANPAVVSIVITQDVPVIERYFDQSPSPLNNPFGGFFGDNFFQPFQFQAPQYRQRGTEKREVGGGSGFLISGDGLILTNRHVVQNDDVDYTVFLNDGSKHSASVVARDPANDLAVLKIDGSDLPFLELSLTDELQVGQSVIAIGNALAEFRNTVSVGVVSGLSRSIVAGTELGQAEQLDEVIQTDAAINPGNSGGPLIDLEGLVVGVNVAVALGSQNIGFALPVSVVRDVVTSVQETGTIVRPYLGVRYAPVTASLVQQNNLPVDYGALIVRGDTPDALAVLPGSPADKAGLLEGDIILEVDGTKLDDSTSLASLIGRKHAGDVLHLKVFSKGQEKTIPVTLEEAPQQPAPAP